MPQVYILDNLIRRISENEASKMGVSTTEKQVIIDEKTQEVLDKKPLFAFSRKLVFFLVYNENDIRNVAQSNIKGFVIDDFATKRKISISIEYKVSCSPGNENKVALNLFDGSTNTPGVVFENKLFGWLKAYAEKNIKFNDFTTKYTQNLLDLGSYAESEAKKIGLTLRLRLSLELDESNQLKPFLVDSDHFPLLLKDFEEQVNFRFQANLVIVEKGKVNAILNYGKLPELKDILQEETKQYLRQETCLYDFCYKFDDIVRLKLISHLDQILKNHGRKIEGFFPEVDNKLRMPELDPIQHDVKYDIPAYGRVNIKNTLAVEPMRDQNGEYDREGILKYRKAKISNLEEWLKENLEKTINKHLFGWKYVDFILKYDEQSIKNLFNVESKKIGYSVKLISTFPDLKPLKLRTEGFQFRTDEYFSTKQNSVKVKLGIDVRGKIENLEKIKDILNDPQNDIDELIGQEVLDAISQVLHDVEPDDFYYYFEYHQHPKEEPIKKKLVKKVNSVLTSKFHASSIRIYLSILETDLIQHINKLKSESCKFEIRVGSVKDAGEIVKYSGSFSITGVAKEKWDIFQSRECSIEKVREFLEEQLKYYFRTLGTGKLIYKDTKQAAKILQQVNVLAEKDVINEFGLIVTLSRFGREDTKIEELERANQFQTRAKELAEAQEQIIQDQNLRLVERSISLDEIGTVQKELSSVREYLQKLSSQSGNEERKNKYRQQEKELKQKLSELLQTNREKANKLISQQYSLLAPSVNDDDDDDFDALVNEAKLELQANKNTQNKLTSDQASPSVDDDDQVIDI